MKENHYDVALEPNDVNQDYAEPHIRIIQLSDKDKKKIEFVAKGSDFAVVIPKNCDGKFLFVENSGVKIDPWICSISPTNYVDTPEFASGLVDGDEWTYYVYCEKTKEWVDKEDSSPPKIIIKD